MRARTSACVGKKLGCAYGFGVGDCVDMRLIRYDRTAMLGCRLFFFFLTAASINPLQG